MPQVYCHPDEPGWAKPHRSMAGTRNIHDPFRKCNIGPDDLIPRGDELIKVKRHVNAERALWYYDMATKYYPGDVRIAYGKSIALGIMTRYEEAHDIMDEALEANQDDPTAAVTMIRLLRMEERHQEALELAEDTVVRWPRHTDLDEELPTMRRKISLEERRLRMVDKRMAKPPDELVDSVLAQNIVLQLEAHFDGGADGDRILLREYASLCRKKCDILNNLSRRAEALESAETALGYARKAYNAILDRYNEAGETTRQATKFSPERIREIALLEEHEVIMAVICKIKTLSLMGRYADALACCEDAVEEFGTEMVFSHMQDKLRTRLGLDKGERVATS